MDAQPRQALQVDHHRAQPPTAGADWQPSKSHSHQTRPRKCHRMRATAELPRCVHPENRTRLDRQRANARATDAIHPCECMHAERATHVVQPKRHGHPAPNRAFASRARSSRHVALSTRHVAPRATSTRAPRRVRRTCQRPCRSRNDPAMGLLQQCAMREAVPKTTAQEVQHAAESRREFQPWGPMRLVFVRVSAGTVWSSQSRMRPPHPQALRTARAAAFFQPCLSRSS